MNSTVLTTTRSPTNPESSTDTAALQVLKIKPRKFTWRVPKKKKQTTKTTCGASLTCVGGCDSMLTNRGFEFLTNRWTGIPNVPLIGFWFKKQERKVETVKQCELKDYRRFWVMHPNIQKKRVITHKAFVIQKQMFLSDLRIWWHPPYE